MEEGAKVYSPKKDQNFFNDKIRVNLNIPNYNKLQQNLHLPTRTHTHPLQPLEVANFVLEKEQYMKLYTS